MGPNGKTMLTLLVAALFTLGAVVDSAVATTSTTTAKTTTTKKKVAVAHKPIARPTPPTPPSVKKAATTASSAVSPGTPTASKKALAVPSTMTARVPVSKSVSFGAALAAGSLHNPGSLVVHMAQNDPHIELKP